MPDGDKSEGTPTEGQFTPQQLEALGKVVDEAVGKRIPGIMSANDKALNEMKDRMNRVEDNASPDQDDDRPRSAQTAKERELRQREDAIKEKELTLRRGELSAQLGVPIEHLVGTSESELITSALVWKQLNPTSKEDSTTEKSTTDEPAPKTTNAPIQSRGNPPGTSRANFDFNSAVGDDITEFMQNRKG